MGNYTRQELKDIIKESIREIFTEEEKWLLKNMKIHSILDEPIKNLNISNKLLKSFHKNNIFTIQQLTNLTIEDLKALNNMGRKSITELLIALEIQNLKLRN